jgi:UDP-N-acetylmuramyl pentapeptide phosphotransferase/UDP-N-acetylglucosamine-1-phosphate transferase
MPVMLIGAVLAFILAAGLTPLLASSARARGLLDVPNHRSSHSVATPRIGGIALVAAVVFGTLGCDLFGAALGPRAKGAVTLAVAMGILGLIDDIRPLPALLRLVMQSSIAVVALMVLGAATLPWLPAWLAAAVTVFWMVSLTNAFNFMDGVDGIAGAQAVVAGIGWAAVAAIAGWRDTACLGLLVAAAAGGFLLYNWQPARVFMGDAGSAFLGFLFAALPLTAPSGVILSPCYAVLLMWPFLFDTGFTLLRRLRRRENILSAHRSHLYQRLALTGKSHRDVALFYAGLASLGVVAAVLLAAAHQVTSVALTGAIPLAALWLWHAVTVREAMRRTASSRTMDGG